MASQPPATDEASGGPALSPADFERALRGATAFTQGHGFEPRTALISDLRRALGGRAILHLVRWLR